MHSSTYTQYPMMLSTNTSISSNDEIYERSHRMKSIVLLELQFHSIQFNSFGISDNQPSMTGVGSRHVPSIALPILPTKLIILNNRFAHNRGRNHTLSNAIQNVSAKCTRKTPNSRATIFQNLCVNNYAYFCFFYDFFKSSPCCVV